MNQPKPKRGQAFLNVDTGKTVYLERIKSPLTYLMCDDSTLAITANFFEVQAHSLKQVNKIGAGISSKPKPITTEKKEVKDARNVFFLQMAAIMPNACQECGTPLYAITPWAKRCCTAHIFPKEHFSSIETNPDNIMFLGPALLCRCSCHDEYDRKDAQHRKTMNIYPLALERFHKLKHLMNIEELRRAYTYLGITFQ